MNRFVRLRSIPETLLAMLLLACSLTASAQNFDNIEIRSEKLSPSVYVLFGAGGNVGLSVGDDAVFIVDDQYAPMAPKILAAIKQLTSKPVSFVLNTHWHGDHTGGNEAMGKAGAVIVAHENVRKRMSTEQLIAMFGSKVPPSPKAALPVVTFTSDISLHLNGDEIKATHNPHAHSDGDAIVHFRQSNVIHMGDIYFNGLYPFIDVSSGGHPDGVLAAIDGVLAVADDTTKIIPGHGPMANKTDLKAYREMLATVSGRVKKLVDEGKSLPEILATKPGAAYDERWGKAFIKPEQFVTMLVGAYSRKRP
jgi:cyclase